MTIVYPSKASLRCSTLPTNIRLGWKCLPGTNGLAYYKYSLITTIRSFVTLDPGGWKWQLIYLNFTTFCRFNTCHLVKRCSTILNIKIVASIWGICLFFIIIPFIGIHFIFCLSDLLDIHFKILLKVQGIPNQRSLFLSISSCRFIRNFVIVYYM